MKNRILFAVGVVCLVVMVLAIVAAVVVWQQPGEVKGVTIATVALVGALAALIGSA